MSVPQLKASYCALTWLHIYAVAYYSNYLFFRLKDTHGFGSRENLLVAAFVGLLYVPGSWFGGRFAQRHGYFTALKLGFGGLALTLAAGIMARGAAAEIVVLGAWTVAVCFTWAPLEALTSESNSRAGTARMVGIYNVVWSSGAAVAYFTGGAMLSLLGRASLYWLPALIHAGQFAATLWLERRASSSLPRDDAKTSPAASEESDFAQHHVSPKMARAFLLMAWVANPFAYVAMQTVSPLVPELAARFHLTTTLAGFVASTWMFTRLAAFAVLWKWTAWHYRFGWLMGAFVVMAGGFVALLLAPTLAVLVVAQAAFGLAVGLIYYSSLFYSMDVGSASQGEHGGYHETLIGVGIFLGPAVGAATSYLAPNAPRADVLAVAAILACGLPALGWMRLRARRGQ